MSDDKYKVDNLTVKKHGIATSQLKQQFVIENEQGIIIEVALAQKKDDEITVSYLSDLEVDLSDEVEEKIKSLVV